MPIGQGVKTLQRRAVRSDGWSKARRKLFLEELGETCNVQAAARAAGMSSRNAYALKKRDPEFEHLWAEAMADGAQRLREAMIAQQLGQLSSGDNPELDGQATTPAVPFDPVKAIAALKAFEGFSEGRRRSVRPATQAEVDQALMARLEALALRMIAAEGRAATSAVLPDAGRENGGGDGA